MKKRIILYIIASVICVAINFGYAQFGHGVESNYMTYMFLYPLVIGVLSVIINKNNVKISNSLFKCGIITLTLGSFLQGVFEIAGTATDFQSLYYVVGSILIFAGIISLILKK